MKRKKNTGVSLALFVLTGFIFILSSCGGGGGGGVMPVGSGMISGTAVKGPVNGATVNAFAIANGTMGAQIGSTTTDAQGNFAVSIGTYSGPVMLQLSGGAYADEATNMPMSMHAGDVMTAVMSLVTTGTATNNIQITPLTSMAQARALNMTGGMTGANIDAANAAVGSYFMVNDILHTPPINPLVSGSGTAAGVDQNMKNYGMAIAAMSQYANTLGMPDSSGIVTAMMDDASDGVMDGMMGSTPISLSGMGGMMGSGMMSSTAGTSGLATAMSTFATGTVNKSGLTASNMTTLINQLSASTGQLPGAGGASVNGMISGTAFIGHMSGGTVKVFALASGTMGAQLAGGPMDTNGNFTLPIGAYQGPLLLQMSGGTYTDLATGSTTSMYSGDVMTTVIPSITSGDTMTGIQITPLTSMAQARAENMAGGLTAANISTANTAMGNYFTVSDILTIQPMDPSVTNSGSTATQEEKNYGMTIAAISQEASALGMPYSSGMVTAMMDDASDGVMNGMMGGTLISMTSMGGMMGGGMMGNNMQTTAGTSGLASAMSAFIGTTSVNKSGVNTTAMNALITKLSSSNGIIQ
jgi:hypothetical protein